MQHHFSSYLISSYPILSYQRHVTNSWSTHVLTNRTHVLHMLLQTQAQSNMWPGFRVFRIVYKAGQNMYRTLVLELTLLFPSLAKGNLSLWVRPNKIPKLHNSLYSYSLSVVIYVWQHQDKFCSNVTLTRFAFCRNHFITPLLYSQILSLTPTYKEQTIGLLCCVRTEHRLSFHPLSIPLQVPL